MTAQVTNTAPPPAPAPDPIGVTEGRVADLLIRLERAAPRPVTLTPLAELRPAHDGTGDAFAFATVFVDCADGLGRLPCAIHELRLAADCLAVDPPFPAAPSLAPPTSRRRRPGRPRRPQPAQERLNHGRFI